MQEMIVGLIIVLALLYVVRKVRQTATAKGGCGCGCSGCSRASEEGSSICPSARKG